MSVCVSPQVKLLSKETEVHSQAQAVEALKASEDICQHTQLQHRDWERKDITSVKDALKMIHASLISHCHFKGARRQTKSYADQEEEREGERKRNRKGEEGRGGERKNYTIRRES